MGQVNYVGVVIYL